MIGKAFDVSNWSGPFSGMGTRARPLSAARPVATQLQPAITTPQSLQSAAACIREQGYDLAIIGTQNSPITRAQMSSCVQAGMTLHAYVYLYFQNDPASQVLRALEACADFPVERLWLDCEDAWAKNLTEAQTVEFIQRAADTCIGKVWSGIYTAKWWWTAETGNSTQFKDYPLWNATADGEGDLTPVSYGGWSSVWMEQYAFDTPICGVNTDLNAYVKGDPPAPEPPAPPSPIVAPNVQTYETETAYEGYTVERGHIYRQTTRFGIL